MDDSKGRENWEASFSSGNDNWATPRDLIADLDAQGIRFDLDAAALKGTKVCPEYLGPDHEDPARRDALVSDWLQILRADGNAPTNPLFPVRVWLNPPYSDAAGFVEAAYRNSRNGLEVWVMIFVRTDTKWWQQYCSRAAEWHLIKGRVSFLDPETMEPKRNKKTGGYQPATAPSALVVFRAGHEGPPVVHHREYSVKGR